MTTADTFLRTHLRTWIASRAPIEREDHDRLFTAMLGEYCRAPEYWGVRGWPQLFDHLETHGGLDS